MPQVKDPTFYRSPAAAIAAPPGIKISPKAFGRDRRLPITNRFRG